MLKILLHYYKTGACYSRKTSTILGNTFKKIIYNKPEAEKTQTKLPHIPAEIPAIAELIPF